MKGSSGLWTRRVKVAMIRNLEMTLCQKRKKKWPPAFLLFFLWVFFVASVCSLRVSLHPGLHDGLHRDPPGGEREPGVHGGGAGAAAGGVTGQWVGGLTGTFWSSLCLHLTSTIVGTFLLSQTYHFLRCSFRTLTWFGVNFCKLPQKVTRFLLCDAFLRKTAEVRRIECLYLSHGGEMYINYSNMSWNG